MDSPRVTVVVPAYNAEPYLEDCLQSIASQVFEDFICKVYDDGSQDKTGSIAQRFAARDKRFQYIPGKNLGTPRRVAMAYREVTSEFFCQVDADDKITRDALALTVHTLSRCPQHIGVVYSDYQRMNSDGTPDPEDPHFIGRCRQIFSLRRMQNTGFCAFQFRLIRTSAYQASRGLDMSLETGEDFDMVLKLAEVCQFVHIPRKLYQYRQHKDQTCRKNPSKLEYLCKRMMDRSRTRKANPGLVLAVPYNSVDDAFAIRHWAQQAASTDVLLAIIAADVDPEILECQEYSQHRVEIIPKRDNPDTDYAYIASRMVRDTQTIAFDEALVPSPGVIDDILADRSIPVFTLEPRTSWLLQAGTIQFDVLRNLVQEEDVVHLGDGPPGESALYRLTREEAYRGIQSKSGC